MFWKKAPDVKKEVKEITSKLKLEYIKLGQVHCFRSHGSKAGAYARIWGLPSIWQIALSEKPAYCIEVLSEKYDRLSLEKKREVLIHELTHIPKNFSGALIPHLRKGKRNFHKKVHDLIDKVNAFGR